MASHCPQCRGAEYEWDSLTRKQVLTACPGCQECERLKALGKRMCTALGISTDMDDEELVKACEELIWVRDGYKQDCEAMRLRLALAERLCHSVSRCERNQGRFSCAPLHDARCLREGEDGVASAPCTCGGDEYQEALAAWENENG